MRKPSSFWIIILIFVVVKLILHFTTMTNYELHRDALLYYSLGEHPAWGYVSVPPFTPLISWMATAVFGTNAIALRLFPALIGVISMIVIAAIVKELKGGRLALIIALTAFLVSPAYLRSNSLFQPVTFNQFFWLLSAYLLIRLLRTQNEKLWIVLFLVWGVGFLNKYSMAFFIVAALLSLLITPQRKLLISKYFFMGGVLGILIILPNLIWQYNYNWPVITHMRELNESQFVNVSKIGFIIDQFMMNLPGLIVWVTGLIALLFSKPLKPYRPIGYLYLLVLMIILFLSGKSYYTLGLYTMLFAFGAFALEKFFRPVVSYAILALIVLISIPLIPFSLPVLDYPVLAEYSRPTAKFTNRWEDGQVYAIPQDFADMTGWKELADATINLYQSIPEEERNETSIYAENYGQAGAITFYGHKSKLPEPICFSDNFLLWAPDSLLAKQLIYINDEVGDIQDLFQRYRVVKEIKNPYFRENGLKIYLCSQPQEYFHSFYSNKIAELKNRYR